MRTISITLSIILIIGMVLGLASCKMYESTICNISEIASCENYTEVTVEKNGHLYSATLGHFDESREKCFVIFYNNTEVAEDDKIVFLW